MIQPSVRNHAAYLQIHRGRIGYSYLKARWLDADDANGLLLDPDDESARAILGMSR